MKTKFLFLLVFVTNFISAQDTIPLRTFESIETHSQIFSLSPISKRVDKVNGLVFGVGHFENKKIQNQTINGLNVEVNPAPIAGTFIAFLTVIYLPDIIKNKSWKSNDTITKLKIKNFDTEPSLKLNGVNISTGCFFTTTNMNGLNISLGNKIKNFNGISIAPLGTIANDYCGLSIGVINANNNLKGVSIGIYNQSYELNGLQFGTFNSVNKNRGIQIGVFNKSNSRGFQIGVWNKNTKHAFPLINW